MYRRHVQRPHQIIRRVGEVEHPRPLQDAQHNLRLPLIGLRLTPTAREEFRHRFPDIVFIGQLSAEPLAAVPVVRFRRHYDRAALADSRFSRRHTLDRLIDVLIQRISAVRRDDDIAHHRLRAALRQQESAACRMRHFGVAGYRVNHLLVAVQHHVDNVRQFCPFGRPQHIFMDGISIQQARPRAGMRNELRAMVCQHRLPRRHARQHAFSSAGEAREKVRLNESLSQQQIAFCRQPVDAQVSAGRQRAQMHEIRIIIAVVHHDTLIPHDILAKLVHQFRSCRVTVASRGDQQRDLRIRVAAPDSLQYRWNNQLARHRPRVIARNDDDVLLAPCKLLQPGRTDRFCHRLRDQFRLCPAGIIPMQPRRDHRRHPFFRQIAGNRFLSVRQLNFQHIVHLPQLIVHSFHKLL